MPCTVFCGVPPIPIAVRQRLTYNWQLVGCGFSLSWALGNANIPIRHSVPVLDALKHRPKNCRDECECGLLNFVFKLTGRLELPLASGGSLNPNEHGDRADLREAGCRASEEGCVGGGGRGRLARCFPAHRAPVREKLVYYYYAAYSCSHTHSWGPRRRRTHDTQHSPRFDIRMPSQPSPQPPDLALPKHRKVGTRSAP